MTKHFVCGEHIERCNRLEKSIRVVERENEGDFCRENLWKLLEDKGRRTSPYFCKFVQRIKVQEGMGIGWVKGAFCFVDHGTQRFQFTCLSFKSKETVQKWKT